MNISKLNLMAFGPFTDLNLDFSASALGLHVIYGPNEAGKSSALRAIRDLLFGIPLRSSDNFIHPYSSLRLGASLEMTDGSTLEFVRRKANHKSLRGTDDQSALADDVLDRFLAGIDETTFLTMFGIDHSRLVKGGQEILEGGGSVGKVLFAAGAGLADLHGIQSWLTTESDLLFKPGARKPRINQAIHEWQETRRELGKIQLSVDDWSRHESDLRAAEKRETDLVSEINQKRCEQKRMARICNGAPVVARWKRETAELEGCRDAPLLSEDFASRRSQALIELKTVEQQEVDANDELSRVAAQLDLLDVPDNLLAETTAIEHLRERFGSYRKAMSDRPDLETSRQLAEKDAVETLRKIGRSNLASDIEALRLPTDKVVRIQSLANQYEGLVQKFNAARRERERLLLAKKQAEDRLAAMAEPIDTTQLRNLVQRIQREGDLESQVRSIDGEITKLQKQLDVELSRLSLWKGTADDLERMPAPSTETLERFDEEYRDQETHQNALEGQKTSETEATRRLESSIKEQELKQAVPTEADLHIARQHRDDGCRLLLTAVEKGTQGIPDIEIFVSHFAPGASLGEAFQRSVAAADEVADRLRREADRVATKAKLQSDLDQRLQRIQEIDASLSELNANQQRLTSDWLHQWKNTDVAPLSPREMIAWRRRQQELCQLAGAVRTKRLEVERIQNRIAAAKRAMSRVLLAAGASPATASESLQALLQRSQDHHEAHQRIHTQRVSVEKQLEVCMNDLQQAEQEYKAAEAEGVEWRTDWAVEMQRLGLEKSATTEQANSVLNLLTELFHKHHDADQYRLRIDGIDKDTSQFTGEVRELTTRLAPDLIDQPVEAIVSELNRRLDSAKANRQQRLALEKQQKQQDQKHRLAETAKHDAETLLNVMCQEAGCEKHEDLPQIEERSRRRCELETSIREVEKQLLDLAGGATLEDFVAEIEREGCDCGTLQQMIESLEQEAQRLSLERDEVLRLIEGEKHKMAGMNGNDQAALKAVECERLVAQLGEDLHQLAVLRVAATVLRESIERYRKRNQGPVLDRASQLFAEMTLGSYEELRAEFDEHGDPVLVGVRPGGKDTVGVKGMSNGTCDQLYLAIRVASLEVWLNHHEPIPFIVDDVLLNFDDDRATAALKVLARLSRRTQVIFFTHHQRLVDLATKHLERDDVVVHQLDLKQA